MGSSQWCEKPARLWAAAAKVNIPRTSSSPRCRSFRIPPTVFIFPKISSSRLRFRWLAAGWCA